MRELLQSFGPGRLAKSTLTVMCWQSVRLAALAAWVILVAKWLGPDAYGKFMGVAGLATTVAGLVGLGVGLLMFQSVSVDSQKFALRWRQTLFAYLTSGLVLSVVFGLLASRMFDDVDAVLIIALGVSEVLAFPFVGGAAFAFAAHDRMGWASALPAFSAISRVIFSYVFFSYASSPSVDGYVQVHAASTIVTSIFAVLCVWLLLRPKPARLVFSREDVHQGAGFSGIWFSGSALASWDKALALKIGGAELSGLYAITYRIAAVLAVPVDSLVMAVMPRLFRQGSGEVQHPRLVMWLCMAILVYGLLVALALFMFAHYLPLLLGVEFAPAVDALRWFGLFVLLYGFRQLSAQMLMARNKKRMRFVAEMCALAAMTGLSMWLIPIFGLYGAVSTMLLVEGGLAAAMGIFLLRQKPKAVFDHPL